ncbi:putative lyase [Rosistilla carotiformis]|uniref:Putative lyase n=1 Tax=Rosistilla carotiformis TaxID=2528017 RepID=A0A518JNU8_9BACT|nr:HEAT repeat domain-containing protein [Rosistilla carotiformis]QDV67219.1 putative lyase [Rosistilla carotiformis]
MSTALRTCRFLLALLIIQTSLTSVSLAQSPDVASLLNELRTGTSEQQSAAMKAIVAAPTGPARTAAIAGLVKLLDSDQPAVRGRSAYALGYLAEGNVDVAKALIPHATDSDQRVRNAVIKALIRIKAPRELTMPIWAQTLKSSDPETIMQVIHSMADLGGDAVPALRETLSHPEAAYWALLVVSEIGPDAAELTPELMELVDHAQPEVQLQAIIAIGKIQGDGQKIVPGLVKVLRGDAPLAGKYAACFALSQYPEPTTGAAALEATLEDATDAELKLLAGWSLLTLNPNSDKRAAALTSIIAGLSSDQPRIRQLAIRALGNIKPGANGPNPVVIEAMSKALQDSEPAVISQVVDVLAAKGTAVLGVIKTGLSNKTLRPLAIELARRLGPDAAPLVPELITTMKSSDDPEQVREVAFALAAIGTAAKPASDVLVAELSNENRRVRYSACYALGSIGSDAKNVLTELTQRLGCDDPFLQLSAAWSLLKLQPGDPKLIAQAVPLLTGALQHENEFVRLEAARSLGTLGQAASGSVDQLKALESDESSMVRAAAAEAVAAIQSK